MSKTQATIVVVGDEPEGPRAYPMLMDFLAQLRAVYDEVLYVCGGTRYSCYKIDFAAARAAGSRDPAEREKWIGRLKEAEAEYAWRLPALRRSLGELTPRFGRCLAIAIDDHAFLQAADFFPGRTVYWSFDVLGKDCPFRLDGGLVEAMLAQVAGAIRTAPALIIQDAVREDLLAEALGVPLPPAVYFPVCLGDTAFCRRAAAERARRGLGREVKVVQSGWIVRNRFSNALVASYQDWPERFSLHFRASLGETVAEDIARVRRKPELDRQCLDNDAMQEALDAYDIGFVGYAEGDDNHRFVARASAQLAGFLALGMPVACRGSAEFEAFVAEAGVGLGLGDMTDAGRALEALAAGYPAYSRNARRVFESGYCLQTLFQRDLLPVLEAAMETGQARPRRLAAGAS